MRWIQLARHGFAFEPVTKRLCTLKTNSTADVQAIVYQVGARAKDTLAFLETVASRQSDLCIILVGQNQKPDTVAQFLRNGAFDYVNWPCSLSRLTDSLISGLRNRHTFLEVRNLSGDLATANQSLAKERDTLKQFNQHSRAVQATCIRELRVALGRFSLRASVDHSQIRRRQSSHAGPPPLT